MFTVCLLYVHYIFTICSPYIHEWYNKRTSKFIEKVGRLSYFFYFFLEQLSEFVLIWPICNLTAIILQSITLDCGKGHTVGWPIVSLHLVRI